MDQRTHDYGPVPASPRGLGRDLKRLKTDGAASVAELREFLGQMHGRSPQEVLGSIAESSLVRSMIVSVLAVAALFAVLTVGPWLLGGTTVADETTKTDEPAAAAESQSTAKKGPSTESAGASSATSPVATVEPATTPDEQKAIDALGIGETKAADPKSNPLESNLDNLLDGID